MKIRVGIAGTSGSLMQDGWTQAFAQPGCGFEIVGNASLGSSHAVMLPYRLPLLDDVAMDVLIVDLCVNEQRALNRNLHDPAQTAALFAWLRGWCADRGILPVVLILPHVTTAGLRHSAVRDHWAEMCRAAGLPFLDGYRLLRHACFFGERAPRHFMSGPNHLNPRGAKMTAEVLMETLTRFLQHAQIGTEQGSVHEFRHVHLNGKAERSTSLMTEHLHRLLIGDTLRAETGPGDLVGMVLNMNASCAALVISGQDMRVKRLDSPHARADSTPAMVCWSLLHPVAAADDCFVLSVQPARDMSGQEDNDHTDPGRPAEVAEPAVELAGLVIRGPARARRLVMTSGAEPDLLRLLD
ncbi:MAG: hypothetical protein Q4G22_00720 [Paracoccus sp. (in: a-proteobacteria)]|uniref:hypothetical protein n=1 Tax=Paracoccus sp. TaxID=267 RepID=UPI0026DF0AB5|nr:hypothetical protein [Paracoccus sp. (in: a-proteobacteria)]MDO5630339.1 hypothetical protein [Paracoccus sp. (in: a-proteobacteria)]